VKYFHRTQLSPESVMVQAARYFGARLTPTGEAPRQVSFAGSLGAVVITVDSDGGHDTRVTAATDQLSESELDKWVRHFLGTVHAMAEPAHQLRGDY
jgi:hypothetical protein